MYSRYAQEHFTVVNGRYFWLFVALLAVYLIYSVFDCSQMTSRKEESDYENCCV